MLIASILPTEVALSGAPLVFKILAKSDANTAYTPSTIPENHSVSMSLYVEQTYGAENFTLLGTVASAVPDEAYNYVFDIAASLHDFFQESIKGQTSPIGSGRYFYPSVLRNYYVVFTEKNGVTDIHTLTPPTKRVFFGNSEPDEVMFGSRWLTERGVKWKNVDLQKQILLSWYNSLSDSVEVHPRLKLYGWDNILITTVTSQGISLTPPIPLIDVAAFSVITFDFGGFDFGASYPLSIFGKMVVDDERGNWDAVTFYADANESEWNLLIFYRNRFGVMEMLRCTGEFEQDREITRYESFTAGNYSNKAQYYGHRRQYDADITTVLTFRTGYMTKDEKQNLIDMFDIGDVWYLSNGKYIALRLLDAKMSEYDSFEELTSWVFRAAPRNTQK